MKHSKQVLIIFIVLFLLSQVIGLLLINQNSQIIQTINEETQEETTQVVFENTTIGERPDMEGTQTLLAISIGVLIGTIILLILAKLKKANIWKHWFFLATIITISISLGTIFNYTIAWIIAIILGAWKIYKPNFLIHNTTELLIYPGIAIILVPLLNVFYAFILLVLISIYDAYAVWKSKHMITMAKFAKDANLFPGLAITYNEETGKIQKEKENKKTTQENKMNVTNKQTKKINKKNTEKTRIGILGGGDIAFPLIFTATFLVFLLEQGFSSSAAILYSLIITLFTGTSLLLLFLYGKKDKYYPAMPFISAGCFIGYIATMIIMNLL